MRCTAASNDGLRATANCRCAKPSGPCPGPRGRRGRRQRPRRPLESAGDAFSGPNADPQRSCGLETNGGWATLSPARGRGAQLRRNGSAPSRQSSPTACADLRSDRPPAPVLAGTPATCTSPSTSAPPIGSSPSATASSSNPATASSKSATGSRGRRRTRAGEVRFANRGKQREPDWPRTNPQERQTLNCCPDNPTRKLHPSRRSPSRPPFRPERRPVEFLGRCGDCPYRLGRKYSCSIIGVPRMNST